MVVVGAVLLVGIAPARGEKPQYSQPLMGTWNTGVLDIFIVPPGHGPLVNEEGILGGGPDPMQATPLNDYLAATEDSIAAWRDAVEEIGPKWLRRGLVFNVYVLGRDVPPQTAAEDPEIVIVFDESKTLILGLAAWLEEGVCLVDNSMTFTQSFTYSDMYNVNAQEFGHCLALGHVLFPESGFPTDPVVGHDVMNGLYADGVGGAETHLHCVSNINMGGLEMVFAPTLAPHVTRLKNPTSVAAAGYRTIRCPQDRPRSSSKQDHPAGRANL